MFTHINLLKLKLVDIYIYGTDDMKSIEKVCSLVSFCGNVNL